MKENIQLIVKENNRLDKYLALSLEQSRNQILPLIKNSCVLINNQIITKVSKKIYPNDIIEIHFPKTKTLEPKKVNFDVDILYEDDYLLVINKPSGVIVHDAPSVNEATLVDWLEHKGINLSTISGELRHGIVHRLDKGTSGAMVIAKNNDIHQALSLQLQNKTMGRYYLALVDLCLKEDIIIDRPIARNPNNRLKMSVQPHGKQAKTAFKKLLFDENTKFELIACKLFTGRTHQIRVHLESINRHIVNDDMYGYKKNKTPVERILLHAYVLYFYHPMLKKIIYIKAPLSKTMQNYYERIFTKEKLDENINSTKFKHYFNDMDKWLQQ